MQRLLSCLTESKERVSKGESTNLLVEKAIALICERLTEGLSVRNIAENLKVSREHLCRVFRQQQGLAPHNFIARQRILQACQLLLGGNHSAKEVSAALGYESPAHFSRCFKKITGMPPGKFRAQGSPPML
ncbi:MAG: helix-turn-helix transcriptional regulator [Planctomycetes bacterium]|nr:helix-turn-helix transcriptional regulator [Planctomycetota bacterium]